MKYIHIAGGCAIVEHNSVTSLLNLEVQHNYMKRHVMLHLCGNAVHNVSSAISRLSIVLCKMVFTINEIQSVTSLIQPLFQGPSVAGLNSKVALFTTREIKVWEWKGRERVIALINDV